MVFGDQYSDEEADLYNEAIVMDIVREHRVRGCVCVCVTIMLMFADATGCAEE